MKVVKTRALLMSPMEARCYETAGETARWLMRHGLAVPMTEWEWCWTPKGTWLVVLPLVAADVAALWQLLTVLG